MANAINDFSSHNINNSKDLQNTLKKGAFTRYNVNKALKAYEGKMNGDAKYKDCKITYGDNRIVVDGIANKKTFSVHLNTVINKENFKLLGRIKYALKSSKSKDKYNDRLSKFAEYLIPTKEAEIKPNPANKPDNAAEIKPNPANKPDNAAEIKPNPAEKEEFPNIRYKTVEELWRVNGAEIKLNPDKKKEFANQQYKAAELEWRNNKDLAITYYKRAADNGHLDAQLFLGNFYTKDHVFKLEAVGYSQEALGYNSASYNNKAAPIVVNSSEVHHSKNIETSFKYYKLAADQGNMEAQVFLGDFYSKDQAEHFGVEGEKEPKTNSKIALKYYKLAAKQGDIRSSFEIGSIYYEGKGVEKDYDRAVKHFTTAANNGYGKAEAKLGAMYYEGKEVSKDLDIAIQYLDRAGDITSLKLLATIYRNDYKDLEKADYYDERAAKSGIAPKPKAYVRPKAPTDNDS